VALGGKRFLGAGVALSFAMAIGCHVQSPIGHSVSEGPAVPMPMPIGLPVDPLVDLRATENSMRARMDFVHASASDVALGADPYVVRSAAPNRLVGILRGRAALVELDGSLREVARLPAPESPSGLAVAAGGDIFVVGELSSRVARYRRARGELEPAGSIELSGIRAMRDVTTGPEGVVYVVEDHDGRLVTFRPAAGAESAALRADSRLCHGPLHVLRVARSVIVDCLLDHAIVIRPVDRFGFPVIEGETRIVHDGPMWGLDAVDDHGTLLVAVGGVEDHPLDRTQGSFGFIDSFVTLYAVSAGTAAKLGEVNTSERGLVTPKALKFVDWQQGSIRLAVAGYASDRLALLEWKKRTEHEPTRILDEPRVRTWSLPPGSAMMDRLADGSFVIANPLLDAWVRTTEDKTVVVSVEDETSKARDPDSRLGEALFFTTLMAPWNKSDGRLSRFTCETCHFEGYADGRTHHTGRGDVHATTKPLAGLLSNRPYFSRALDPDLTTMVDNEFAVAGAKSDRNPWFSLRAADIPWLRELSLRDEMLSPLALRRALTIFFVDFTHRPNPSVVGRSSWGDLERKGAEVFRDRCEGCHEARLMTDDPSTRLPFDEWEARVMTREGPIVWARADYVKTGVVPYVHEKGARVVSLRRLYKKFPYFTNGSAKSLGDVLDRVGSGDGPFLHDGAASEAQRLGREDKAALLAFLDLL
jgi:hypothetical protein